MSAGLHDGQLIPTLARKQDEVDSMTNAMAQLFVHGHDLDFRTLFSPAKDPAVDYAPIPPTRFKRKPHWLDANFTADSSAIEPGSHVATPDGRHVWEYAPRGEVDAAALAKLVKAAAAQVLPDAALTAFEQRAIPGEGSRLVTTLTRHPGGGTVQVHARMGESFTLVYDAVVTRGGDGAALPVAMGGTALPAAVGASAAETAVAAPEPEDDAAILQDDLTAGAGLAAGFKKWSPDSGETIADRLGAIVGGAMGYEPEDLPWEVPLIELGLDSLMAVRIKNRVEYDFDLPPIQLTAVRDANLYAVEKLIHYAIEHRDEVGQLAEAQKGQTAEEIAAAQAELMGGATTVAELEAKLAEAGHPLADTDDAKPAAADIATDSAVALEVPPPPTDPSGPAVPPPPTNPSGPAGPNQATAAAAAAKVLTQEAVTEALGADVPPRDAAERVTFATWAIVTGKSPGGIFNELPAVDDATATKLSERLSERAEGIVTVEQVRSVKTIEELSTIVRDQLEDGVVDGFVRTLRAPKEGGPQVPLFVFHPAGGSTVVYEPLLKRLPEDIPVYGIERVEGSIEERAAEYVPKLLEMHKGPFVLAGWSLGGALAYACAIGLKQAGADVRYVGLIDCVRPGVPIDKTQAGMRARWDRYARFAERTFNVEVPEIPYEELEKLDDEGQVKFVLDIVAQSGVQIPGGIIEHQRTSYLDNRALDTIDIQPYDGHVVLYMADRYHDDAIVFEPAYATRQPDGGWGEFAPDLEVVNIGGEHIQAIDEPYIAKVGAHMSQAINQIQAGK
jgi:polyketide synthase 13